MSIRSEQKDPNLVVETDRLAILQERLDSLQDEYMKRRRRTRSSLIFGSILLLAAPVIFIYSSSTFWTLYTFGGALLSLMSPIIRPSSEIFLEIRKIENEIDLIKAGKVSAEHRAEKLFRMHQLELEKYYSLTRRQCQWIFAVGVGCIVLGFLIISSSLYFIISPDMFTRRISGPQIEVSEGGVKNEESGSDLPHAAERYLKKLENASEIEAEAPVRKSDYSGISEKIVLAILGGVGGILSNFIAVIYLKMHSESVRSLTEFHNRLVLTHHVHFSNFLTEKIQDETLREETLSELALGLVKEASGQTPPSEQIGKSLP